VNKEDHSATIIQAPSRGGNWLDTTIENAGEKPGNSQAAMLRLLVSPISTGTGSLSKKRIACRQEREMVNAC